MKKIVVLLLILFAVAGCKTLNPQDSAAVAAEVKVVRDDFKKITLWRGPSIFGPGDVFIRAWKPDGGVVTYQIYVQHGYHDGWRYYDTAYDSNGIKLNAILISRDVISCVNGNCLLSEVLGLDVDKEYLERARATGIRFKVSGRAGEEVFSLPGGYISGFLNVVE